MKLYHGPVTAILLALFLHLPLQAAQNNISDRHVHVSESSSKCVSLFFNTTDLSIREVEIDGELFSRLTLPDEALTPYNGQPALPAVSRFVIVPPRTGLELTVTSKQSRHIDNLPPPENCFTASVYPTEPAVMSHPVVMRGVRMVQITAYPVQYNPQTKSYIHHEQLDVKIRFTDDAPVNPVLYTGPRRNRSREFVKMMRALAVNTDQFLRDEGEIGRDRVGHYLVVTHDSCLVYAIPLIEWKRRAGWKVDILRYTHDEAQNAVNIKRDIQNLYVEYLNQGIDPFDHILILGDRIRNVDDAPWTLNSFIDSTSLRATPPHADYVYGCLEGDDPFPEVAVGRFASGMERMMELAVGRMLAYEMEPYMEDTGWFERAGVFSQQWGDNWNMTLVYTTRWGYTVLAEKGFQEILVQEATQEGDPQGNICWEAMGEWFNDGMSIMIGRAQLGLSSERLAGLETNTVFPIGITTCGHGEFSAQNLFRDSDGDHLKGPVAWITGWGDPTTIHENGMWFGIVKGLLIHDMTLGWARLFGGVNLSIFFPGDTLVVYQYQTDTDLYGDPGIQPWIGIPRLVETRHPVSFSPGMRSVEITVYREGTNDVIPDAQVTLYYPGEMPDEDDYHEWQPEFMTTGRTDLSGKIRLPIDPDINDGSIYLTVTGRDIYPTTSEIPIEEESVLITLSDIEIDDSNGGNDDGIINPGETITVSLTAANIGGDGTVNELYAEVSSNSPYLTVEPNHVVFGDLEPGEIRDGNTSVTVSVSPGCPDRSEPELIVDFTSNNYIWRSVASLDVWGSNLEVYGIEDGNLVTSDARELNIEIINNGRIESQELSACLLARDFNVIVLDEECSYPAVSGGETSLSNGERLRVVSRDLTIPGSRARMMLVFYLGHTPVDTAGFELVSQEAYENSPMGPDSYGYYCYDDTDREWGLAPQRNSWFEISVASGAEEIPGIKIRRFDTLQVNSAIVIELPFNFRFYGREYDRITVCINGFIGVGDQESQVNSQNYPMDQAVAGPMGMIAPFWTKLTTAGPHNPGVYYVFDDEYNRFIIEWYHLHFQNENSDIDAQIIISDPEYYPTLTGDSEILFNYRSVPEAPQGTLPPSVGISSPDGTTGVNYTYRNEYPVQAATLERDRAILFTTTPGFLNGVTSGTVHDADGNGISEVAVKALSDFGFEARAVSNEDGEFSLIGLFGLPGIGFEGIKLGYRGTEFELDTLVEGDSILVVDLELLRPDISLSCEAMREFLVPGHKTRRTIVLTNNGTGPFGFVASLGGNEEGYTTWLDLETRTGFVDAGTRTSLTIVFDATDLESGDYTQNLIIEDTLAQVGVEVPIYLNIGENNDISDRLEIPFEWSLDQSYPNPFNSTTVISYSLKERCFASLIVFDLNGRVVASLIEGEMAAGRYRVVFDQTGLPTGVYIYRLEASMFTATRKMILIR